VGHQCEVDALEGWFQRAATGNRQLVFVSGEVGIDKTTVVDLWLARCATEREVRMARGQCVEHVGEGEPYLPLLDALGQLGRGPTRGELLAVLRRYAPMWLTQLPGLVSEPEREQLQRQVQGAMPARMLWECAEALAALTVDTPLVLVLEDLHRSDLSTIECLTAVAQRREAGVGAGHAGGRGHRYGAHPTGDGSGADYRSEAEPPLSPWLPGGGVWPGRAARGRAVGAGRGLDAGGGNRGAVVGSGGVSAQGELLLQLPLPDILQATACFHQALDVARRQQTKALELRAALSLSRLWQQQGQRDQARQLLTEIYSWFTEGFETPGLQEARMWLEAS
jgi:hypothetical protein